MEIIKEVRNRCSKYFELWIDEKRVRTILIKREKVVVNNKEYVCLVNDDGKIDENSFRFLNFSVGKYGKDNSKNTVEQEVNAIKLLLTFCSIKMKKLEDFTDADIYQLSNFVLGRSIVGNTQVWQLITKRSNNTHNLYIGTIRRYAAFNGISIPILFNKSGVTLGGTKYREVQKYRINRTNNKTYHQYVPKYISLEEYYKIIRIIDQSNSKYKLRNKIIINLMFTRGLRIGEILGITLEDIKAGKDEYGYIVIRNRISDKKYQFAKTCYKPCDKEDYSSAQYNTANSGYYKIIVPNVLMDDIYRYIEESRDILKISPKIYENISSKSIADSVESYGENYYLFINKNGSVLSISGWNKYLKKIYKQVGISIDYNSRRDNLNHRFRHGYAMYLIDVEKKNLEFVKEELRHKSITSTLIYYNPKEEDIIRDSTKIANEIHNKYEGKND